MKILGTGYTRDHVFESPQKWLEKIGFYTCILEALSNNHDVNSIEQIHYSGKLFRNGVHYHFLQANDRFRFFPFRLHRYIKKLEPTVVLVNGFIAPFQLIQLKWMLGSRTRILVINRAEKPAKGIRRLLQKLADRSVYKYLFTSVEMGMPWVKEKIIQSESKLAAVIGASSVFTEVDQHTARGNTGVSGSPAFLFVGRLDKNKDPMTVLQAFRIYATEQPAARLYMIYQTTALLEEIKELIDRENSLQGSVVLVGQVPHDTMGIWYSSADFIISASHYEGSGIAVCEAMSCGCIPILTDIPSFRAMTGNGSCGFMFEPGNAGSLLKILLQTEQMDQGSERAKTIGQFREQLSVEAIAAKIESIITEE